MMEQTSLLDVDHHSNQEVTITNGSELKQQQTLSYYLQMILFGPSNILDQQQQHHHQQQHQSDLNNVICRKSQAVIASSPVKVFLSLMNTNDGNYFWPNNKDSSLKVIQDQDVDQDVVLLLFVQSVDII